MIFITRIKLKPTERKVVRKICKIQMQGLEEIIGEKSQIDTRIYEMNNGLEYGSIHPIASQEYANFKAVYEDPESFPSLPADSLSVFKHVLFNFISERKYPKTKKAIWSKLFKIEKYSEQTGLN